MKSGFPMVPLKEVLTPVSRPEIVDPQMTYCLLGAHWYAKGLYTKGVKMGSEIRAKRIYRVEQGDFVYNRLFAWKGSFAIATEENHGCYVSNEFPCFTIKGGQADVRYLWRYFSRALVWNEVLGLSAGGTPTSRNRLKEAKLLAMKIPLPPLEEQQRIVARIEELAAKIEEAQELRRQAAAEAEMLLDVVTQQVFGNSSSNSDWYTLEQADLSINQETHNPSYDDPTCQFMYVDISSVTDGPCTIKSGRITLNQRAPSRARRVIHKDDIIFSTVRPYLRSIAKVGEELDEQICSTGFAVFSCGQTIDADFLLYQVSSPIFIEQCMQHVTGGHYPALNEKNLKNIHIYVPSLGLQHRIAAYLDNLQAKVDTLKRLQAGTSAKLDALLSSIFDKAFKGEL